MCNVYDEQMNERVGVNYNHNKLGTANFPERLDFVLFLVSTIENKEKKKMLIFKVSFIQNLGKSREKSILKYIEK